MKKIYLMLITCIVVLGVKGQTYSKNDLFGFVNGQNKTQIISRLVNDGFEIKKSPSPVFKIYGKTEIGKKADKYTTEAVTFGNINGLFMIQYQPKFSLYSRYKEIVLTKSYSYKYSYGNAKYYENDIYRIGLDDKSGLISIFTNEL